VSTSYGELSQRKVQGNGYNGNGASYTATSSTRKGPPPHNNKIEAVQAMEAAAFSGDMETFMSYLTDDVYYRVGNATEVVGPQAIVDYMGAMMASSLAINDMKIIGAWEIGDTVVVEFNIGGFRYDINQQIRYPCIDIYRFRGNQIRDWRVFAIDPTFVVK
jgi:hypothetical protein